MPAAISARLASPVSITTVAGIWSPGNEAWMSS